LRIKDRGKREEEEGREEEEERGADDVRIIQKLI
jgi:hypothetical protein